MFENYESETPGSEQSKPQTFKTTAVSCLQIVLDQPPGPAPAPPDQGTDDQQRYGEKFPDDDHFTLSPETSSRMAVGDQEPQHPPDPSIFRPGLCRYRHGQPHELDPLDICRGTVQGSKGSVGVTIGRQVTLGSKHIHDGEPRYMEPFHAG